MIRKAKSIPRSAKPQPAKAAPRPQGDLLGSLKIWQKLLLVVLGFLIPVGLGLSLLVSNQNRQIAFSAKEQIGVRYLIPVVGLLEAVQKHRNLSYQWLLGNASVEPELKKAKQEVRASLQALKAVNAAYGGTLQSGALVENLESELGGLLDIGPGAKAEGIFQNHTQFINQHLLKLIAHIGNSSNLILDPDLDSYWTMSLVIQTLPQLAEQLGFLRGQGTGLLMSGGSLSNESRFSLQSSKNQINTLLQDVEQAVDFALEANKTLGPTAVSAYHSMLAPIYDLRRIAEVNLLASSSLSYSPTAFYAAGTLALDKTYSFYQVNLSELDRLLGTRVQKMQRQQLLQLVTVALALVLTFLLVSSIIRRITRPINQLYAASQSLSRGNLNINVPVEALDETGQLARVFNETVEQLRAKALSDSEALRQSAQLQHNIGEFLQVAMNIAGGDLRQKGRVTEDVLGNVVDAINLMTEEVGFLLKDVQKAAVQVNQGAAQMDQLTGTIFKGAQAQASEAQEVRQDTAQVSQAIRQMAESAGISSQAAQQTLEAAGLGRAAVNQTLSGMSDIRSEMQGIAENIHTLAGRSAEIESIARTLEEFASQTNLLALNASFEAAGAGAAGRRFAIVAEEIRKLAEDSARETQRVSMLVRQVQGDIGTVVAMAQDGVREAETGYRVATLADQRLQEIAQFSTQSSSLAQQIAQLAQRQVSAVARVDQAVQKIAATAQNTEQDSLKGRQAAEIMRRLADQLTKNLGRFELP